MSAEPRGRRRRLLHDRDTAAEFWRLRPARRDGGRCDRPDYLHLRCRQRAAVAVALLTAVAVAPLTAAAAGRVHEPRTRASASKWIRASELVPTRVEWSGRAATSWITTSISTRRTGRSGALAWAPPRSISNANPPLDTPVIVPAYGRIFRRQDVGQGHTPTTWRVRIQF